MEASLIMLGVGLAVGVVGGLLVGKKLKAKVAQVETAAKAVVADVKKV
jgi:hypothetical protein